jgi:LPXTG-motif cell wall-anchored protein
VTGGGNGAQAISASNATADATLPQTASSVPLVGIVGLSALAGLLALRKLGAAKA